MRLISALLLGAGALGVVGWVALRPGQRDPSAFAAEYAVTLTESAPGEVTITGDDEQTWRVRPFEQGTVARRVGESGKEFDPLVSGKSRLWIAENGEVLLRHGERTETLARARRANALRLTPASAIWIEERTHPFDERNAWIGRRDRARGITRYTKVAGTTSDGASADAEGNVIFLKYLPTRGGFGTFLGSATEAVEALPESGGTPLLLTGGEIVAPQVVGEGRDASNRAKIRLARLAGRPGARRWETLPVRFEP